VEPDDRIQVRDLGEDDVDGHDRQERGEHLDDQQEQQARATALEPVPRERERRERGEREREQRRAAGDEDRVDEPPREVCPREQVLEVVEPELLGDQVGRAQRAQGVERCRRDEQDRDQREDDRADGDEMAPAKREEQVLARHRLISSRAAVRLNPMIENTATITKIRTEIAAANPYWAPPSVNASR